MLTVYLDFRSPESYLALQPTLALVRDTACEVRWLPLRALSRALPTQSHNPTRTAAHGRVRAVHRERINQHYAKLQGISLERHTGKNGTDAALAALVGIAGDATPFVEACFKAYWQDQKNLNCSATVAELLDATVPCAAPASTEALDRHFAEAEAAGVIDVPALMVDGEVFVGRAHLPWIRELLTQRTD